MISFYRLASFYLCDQREMDGHFQHLSMSRLKEVQIQNQDYEVGKYE